MKVLGFVLLIIAMGTACDSGTTSGAPTPPPKPYCIESVCVPSWSSNCYCNSENKMIVEPSGAVFCSCPDSG